MAPLGAAGRQLHVNYWAKRVDNKGLHPEFVQLKLCKYFSERGEILTELPLDVDREDLAEWKEQWRRVASDAGVEGEADRESVILLLMALSRSGLESRHKADTSQRVMDTLASAGVTVPVSAHAVISKVLSKSKRESDKKEWVNLEAVFIIYFLIAPSNADEEWYERELDKILCACDDEDSADDEDVATVNMRLAPSAIKVLAKEQGSPTLERVLAKGGDLMLDYFESVQRKLNAVGLHAAAQRFQTVVSYCVRRHRFDEKMQRQYLQRYFFVDYLGRGLMKLKATNSLTAISADRHMAPPATARIGTSSQPQQLLTPGCLPTVGGDSASAMSQMMQMFAQMQNANGRVREPHGPSDTDVRVEDVTDGAQAFRQQSSGESRVYCQYCAGWHKNAGVTCEAFLRDKAKAQAHSKAQQAREKAAGDARKAAALEASEAGK